MSSDSEELILSKPLQDDTIITVRGSSDDANLTPDNIEGTTSESEYLDGDDDDNHGEGDDNNIDHGAGGNDNHEDGDDMDTSDTPGISNQTDGSSGDINTDDLTEFEKSMKKLEVTGNDDGPKVDSGKRVSTTPVQTDTMTFGWDE